MPALPIPYWQDVRPWVSPSLRERILAKLEVQPSGCVHWTGGYNVDGRKSGRVYRTRRPVVYLGGGDRGPIVYVAPLLLALDGDGNLRPERDGVRLYALHTCRPSGDGWYRCVAIEHLRWGTQAENEQDKKQLERLEGVVA